MICIPLITDQQCWSHKGQEHWYVWDWWPWLVLQCPCEVSVHDVQGSHPSPGEDQGSHHQHVQSGRSAASALCSALLHVQVYGGQVHPGNCCGPRSKGNQNQLHQVSHNLTSFRWFISSAMWFSISHWYLYQQICWEN